MANSNEDGNLSAIELAQAALTTVAQLTGHRPEAATGLEWDGESWCVTVEVLELPRIPSTTDILGAYQVRLDGHGTLRGYKRLRRYSRGEARDEE
jgi:hypothetical protein